MALPHNVVKLAPGEPQRPRPDYPEALRIYHACRERLLEALNQGFFAQLGPVQDRLLEAADSAPTMDMRNVYYAAQGALRDRAEALSRTLDAMMPAEPRARPAAAAPLDELKLVDDEDLDQTLAITKASSRLRYQCAEQLTALEQRLAVLMGESALGDDLNPLGPKCLCQMFVDACERLGLSGDVRLTLLQQFDRLMGPALPQAYHDINQWLAGHGILPNIRVGLGDAAPRRASPPEPAARAPGDSGEADVFELLRRALVSGLGGGLPGLQAGAASQFLVGQGLPGVTLPAGIAPGQGAAAGMQGVAAILGVPGATATAGAGVPAVAFLPRLTALQRGDTGGDAWGTLSPAAFASGEANILRELKAAPIMAGAGELDAMVIDIVAMLFDFILDDAAIPAPIKALIGRLQIPVLKVAMLDRKFFSHKQHPARRLLDKLAELALGWNGEADSPLYRNIDATVHAVLDGFDDNLDIFETLAAELDQCTAQDETVSARQVEVSIESLEREERGEIAGIMAEDQIRRLISHETPDALRDFMRQTWTRVLAHAYADGGEQGAAWLGAVETAAQLAWSATPKRDVRERLKLVQILPGLLKSLRVGMDSITLPGEEREYFFAQLVTIHAAAVRVGLAPATVAAAAPESSPEPVIAAAEAHDPARAAEAPTGADAPVADDAPAADDTFMQQVRGLQIGDWLEFQRGGEAPESGPRVESSRRAKLSWISARRGIYLFTNTDGMESFSISAARLAERLRASEARALETSPLTERAVSSLLARLMPGS